MDTNEAITITDAPAPAPAPADSPTWIKPSRGLARLASMSGVTGVAIRRAGTTEMLPEHEGLRPVFTQVLVLFDQATQVTGEPSMRVQHGDVTITVQRCGDTLLVQYPTGHAIAKSVLRAMRRAAKWK